MQERAPRPNVGPPVHTRAISSAACPAASASAARTICSASSTPPTGKSSEEVIGAAITAGNAPCLIFNTSPAAVPGFQKLGGLVALDEMPGGKQYVEGRTGTAATQYQSPDGKYYQLPWKSNPVMIFYNKELFEKAGMDPDNPPLASYDEFLSSARKIVSSGAADAAIYPAPTSEFFQSWFDFYPLFIAASGKQLVQDGKPQFDSPEGQQVVDFWKTLYSEGLVPNEKYNGDAFADGKAAMAIVGPWAIAVYGDDVDWGVAPVPTEQSKPASDIHTFSDEKSAAMYSACQNRGTAWDVLKFATSKEQDGAFLEASGQMPMRQDLAGAYPRFFEERKEYTTFADQAARTIEVPNVPNSVRECSRSLSKALTSSMPWRSMRIPFARSVSARRPNAPSRSWYSAKRRRTMSIEICQSSTPRSRSAASCARPTTSRT